MNPSNQTLGFALLRATVGLNFLMHGATRIFGDLSGFANGMAESFAGTLPRWLVVPYAYALTCAELLLGLALLIGFRTAGTATLLMALVISLIFGKTLQQDWGTVGTQMLYSLILFLLVFLAQHDGYGITARRKHS